MTDHEYLLYAFKGNADAARLVLLVASIADVWDNLIDCDPYPSAVEINAAFFDALITIPRNKFFRAHQDDLLPIMTTGIFNWWTANQLEHADGRLDLEIAHVIRYGIADLALFIAGMIGGNAWLEAVGPELRLRSQKSDFAEYLESLRPAGEKQ